MPGLRLLHVRQEGSEWQGELFHKWGRGGKDGEKWYTLYGPNREDITRQANRLKAAHLKSEQHHQQDRQDHQTRMDKMHKEGHGEV